jgi:hypothetical protein
MERFNIGDAILILPKFAHLYPSRSGVIIDVKRDPFRAIFNELTIKLSDGSTTNLFEYEILEDESGYQTFGAALVQDSQWQSSTQKGVPASRRQVLLRARDIEIHLQMHSSPYQAWIAGQVIERSTSRCINQARVTLVSHNVPTHTATTDNAGEFKLTGIPRGLLDLYLLIRSKSSRVLGTFCF